MCVALNVSFNGEYALLDLDLKSYNIKFLIKILKKKSILVGQKQSISI